MSPIDDRIREIQALVNKQAADFSAAIGTYSRATAGRAMAFPIGAAVLDLVTGEKGVVVNGKRENVIISPAGNNGR